LAAERYKKSITIEIETILLRFVVYFVVQIVEHQNAQLIELECGPMPNVMAALPNIGGTIY